MNERISVTARYAGNVRRNFEWYDAEVSDSKDAFETPEELTWYILEGIADDDMFTDAISIEAEDVLTEGSREIRRLSTVVR